MTFSRTGMRGRISALLVAASLLALAPVGLRAQDESSAQFWLQDRARGDTQKAERPSPDILYQRPTHLIPRAKPVRGFTHEERARPPAPKGAEAAGAAHPPATQAGPATQMEPGAAASGTPAPTAGAAAAQAPASAPVALPSAAVSAPPATPAPRRAANLGPPERVFHIAVLGDSLGEFLEQGLADLYGGRADVAILPRAEESSGLVRADFYDWPRAARDLADGKQRVDMAIVMLGSNDRQPMRDGAGLDDPLSPKWRQAYAARVDAVVAAFRDKKIPLLWVGAPIMKSPSLSDAMLAFNDIYKSEARGSNVAYLDVWDQFADENGRYALYGPDAEGDNAKLRSADGVNFTHAGARKLAQFVSTEIQRVMDAWKPAADAAIAGVAPQVVPAALPNGAKPIIAGRDEARQPGDLRSLVPAPAAPINPVIPIRPSAGPLVALTTPVVAPDGKLVSRSLVQASSEGASDERVIAEGAPIQPRADRADDFRWPRD